jgi:hypothetical protein
VVDRVALVLQLLGRDAVLHDVVPAAQLLDRGEGFGGDSLHHAAQGGDPFRRRSEAEDLGTAGGAIDPVHDVVQVRCQEVDVFPVDGRDEDAIQPVHDAVRDVVGLVLEALDLLDAMPPALRGPGEQLSQVARGLVGAPSDLDEVVEERLLAGEQPGEQGHGGDTSRLAGRPRTRGGRYPSPGVPTREASLGAGIPGLIKPAPAPAPPPRRSPTARA